MAISSSKKACADGAGTRRRVVKGASLRRWVRRARGKGLTGPELVFELHVRRGLKLPEVAQVLRVDLKVVREHWRESRAARAAPPSPLRVDELAVAPRSEGDLAALREHVSVALWETVVATFTVPEVTVEGEEAGPPMAKPPLMSVRLRALRQMGRLYGVGRKRRASGAATEVRVACATPEEIAESVRERRMKDEA